MTRIDAARVALAAALAAAAAGCGGEGGKELKVGQPATVSYTDDTTKVKSTVELTPTSIEKKSIADLSAIDLEPSLKSSTPYFVKVHYKNVGGPIKKDGYSVYSLNAIDDRDENLSSLTAFGGFPPCNEHHPDRLAKGKAFDSCLVFMVSEGGAPISSLEWRDNSIDGHQRVLWKP